MVSVAPKKKKTKPGAVSGPSFKLLTNPVSIDKSTCYSRSTTATHVGARNGQVAFFTSDSDKEFYRSRSKWRFWMIPEGETFCYFPEFEETASGYSYGKPKFGISTEEEK